MDKRKLLAEFVAGVHLFWIIFIVVGIPLRYALPEMRPLHTLGMVMTAVAYMWWKGKCPLTLLEVSLRPQTGSGEYQNGFISGKLKKLLDVDVPERYFNALFISMVLLTFFL